MKLEETLFSLSLQIVNCACWLIPNAAAIADRCWLYLSSTDTLGFIRWCEILVRLHSCCADRHLQIFYAWDHELAKALQSLQVGTVAVQMRTDTNGTYFQHGIQDANM